MDAVESAMMASATRMGYSTIREEQKDAVMSFFSHKDVLVLLPTGTGKSLCYLMLPWTFDCVRSHLSDESSIIVVVSPLVALMTDQSNSASEKGLSAAVWSTVRTESARQSRSKIVNGLVQVVFVSPEALFESRRWHGILQSVVYQSRLVGFIVDEAHCIKKWGCSFRRSFALLGEIRSIIPASTRVMALTATASKATVKVIIKTLGMRNVHNIIVNPSKPNIRYIVCFKESMEELLNPIVDRIKKGVENMGRIIVYCSRCKDVSDMYGFLEDKLGSDFTHPPGVPHELPEHRVIDMYSKSTHPSVQRSIVSSFTSSVEASPLRVVIATVAFGFGINCCGVKQVIHWGPTEDIEDYVQETGRAGRDGKPACALLCYNKRLNRFADDEMKEYCTNTDTCRRQKLFSHFDGTIIDCVGCSCCDVCMKNCECGMCEKLKEEFIV